MTNLRVDGVCPACGRRTLYRGRSGGVFCGDLDCPDPIALHRWINPASPPAPPSTDPAADGDVARTDQRNALLEDLVTSRRLLADEEWSAHIVGRLRALPEKELVILTAYAIATLDEERAASRNPYLAWRDHR